MPELPGFALVHKKRLKEGELLHLLEFLKERLGPSLGEGDLVILDTTGIPHRGKTQKLKWIRGKVPRVVRGHARLCVAAACKKQRLLLPVGMSVGPGFAPDPLLGTKALRQASPDGILLDDAGFDASVFREARGKFLPMIRLKGGREAKDAQRSQAHKAFRKGLYRLRAAGEGLFGALNTRLNGRLRDLRLQQTQKEALLLVLCYLLRVFLAFCVLFWLPPTTLL